MIFLFSRNQLVWGETNLVGCGFSYYQDSRRFNKLYVCNYGPGYVIIFYIILFNPFFHQNVHLLKYFFFSIFFSINSGNVVGVQPYAVGAPSCSNHGMYPSSKYSGLCVSTQTVYAPNNQVITQNTYTFKSERINPTVYRTVTAQPTYNPYATTPTSAVQAYQQALQAYQNPNQSYEEAQQNYQVAIQAYNQAYGQPQSQPQQSYSYTPAVNNYDWSAYFG